MQKLTTQQVNEMPFKDRQGLYRQTKNGTQLVRFQPKIQRNEPCVCGSGLKYKNCHLKK